MSKRKHFQRKRNKFTVSGNGSKKQVSFLLFLHGKRCNSGKSHCTDGALSVRKEGHLFAHAFVQKEAL